MLKTEEIKKIKQYIDPTQFDINRIINYLDEHELIDESIFAAVASNRAKTSTRKCCDMLGSGQGFSPVSRAVFLKRIPFYFFCNTEYSSYGDLGWVILSYGIPEISNDSLREEKTEEMYVSLEYLFYQKGFELEDMFSYVVKQYGVMLASFDSWVDYIKLCDLLSWDDYFPESFISNYNYALEAAGRQPIIYNVDSMLVYATSPFYRRGKTLTFEGTFPKDKEGHPVLRWTNLIVEGAANISCNTDKSHNGELYIEITPETKIYAENLYGDAPGTLFKVYAGPKHVDFDNSALKSVRKDRGYTQKEIAEAIDVSIRTYQKWEAGLTTPDSRYMLRLLNWLDIEDSALLSKDI